MLETTVSFHDLTEEAMYKAVVLSDPLYDGVFYVGVLSTNVFCFPSCSCRKPSRKNTRFFSSSDEAVSAGFRPCKRCMPHIGQGRVGYEQSLVDRAEQVIGLQLTSVTIDNLCSELNLSRSHLQRLFRKHRGVTIGSYIASRKASRAAQLLLSERKSVTDISIEAGFGSISSFYENFYKTVGMAPGVYRRATHADNAKGVNENDI